MPPPADTWGTHEASGKPPDARFVHHWTVENGKVTRFQQDKTPSIGHGSTKQAESSACSARRACLP